jgi:predicted secreted protein
VALPGYNFVVSVATGASGAATKAIMDGIQSCTISDGDELLDITDFADSRLRRRIIGLRDISVSLEGDLEATSTAFQRIRAARNAGLPFTIQMLADGTNGIEMSVLTESIERSASVEGKVSVSFSLQHEGAYDPFDVGTGL